MIQGTGVEDQHCYIVNEGATVILHPIAILCAVDGLQVSYPIKLTSGKLYVIILGANYRLKTGEEAEYLKKIYFFHRYI